MTNPYLDPEGAPPVGLINPNVGAALTMAPGNVNPAGDETMLGILQRLRDLSAQPLVPSNPMAQLGAMFQGFASGTQGQANPALTMYANQRQQQMTGLAHEATVGGMLSTERNQQALRSAQAFEQQLQMVKELPETDPISRGYKVQMLQGLMKSKGMEMPPGLSAAWIAGKVTPEKLASVAKLVVRGYTQGPKGQLIPGPGVGTDASIAQDLDLPIARVSEARQAFLSNPNMYLASIGAPTLTKLAEDEADLKKKNFEAMIDTNAPELRGNHAVLPYMYMATQELYPKKQYWELPVPDRHRVLTRAVQNQANDEGLRTGQRAFEVLMAKQDAANNAPAVHYFNANPPYQPLSSSTTVATAKALEATHNAVQLPDLGDRQVIKYVMQLKKANDEYRDAVRSLPEYFPVETGNQAQDLINLGAAGLKYTAGATRVDPRTVPISAMRRHIVNLGKISGSGARMSNMLLQIENEAGGFDKLAGRETKTGLANQVETFLNSQLSAMGLNALPAYTPGRIERLPSGKVVRLLPDGTQYIIGTND